MQVKNGKFKGNIFRVNPFWGSFFGGTCYYYRNPHPNYLAFLYSKYNFLGIFYISR